MLRELGIDPATVAGPSARPLRAAAGLQDGLPRARRAVKTRLRMRRDARADDRATAGRAASTAWSASSSALYLLRPLRRASCPAAASSSRSQGMLPDAQASPLAYAVPERALLLRPALPSSSRCWSSAAVASVLLRRRASTTASGGRVPLVRLGLPLRAQPAHRQTRACPTSAGCSWPTPVLPRAPYGSLAARGRRDPGGGWRMPAGDIRASPGSSWPLGYSYSGLTKLVEPVVARRERPRPRPRQPARAAGHLPRVAARLFPTASCRLAPGARSLLEIAVRSPGPRPPPAALALGGPAPAAPARSSSSSISPT